MRGREHVKEWWQAARHILGAPAQAFEQRPGTDAFKQGSVFLATTHTAVLAIGFVLALVAVTLSTPIDQWFGSATNTVIGFSLLIPVWIAAHLGTTLLMAGAFHVVYHYVGAENGFAETFNSFAYATAIFLLYPPLYLLSGIGSVMNGPTGMAVTGVVLIGFLGGALYGIYLQVQGVKTLQGLRLLYAAAPYLIILGVTLLLGGLTAAAYLIL